jgi:hypothetical protein
MWIDRLRELGKKLHESNPESPEHIKAHNAQADEIRKLILQVLESEERSTVFDFLLDPTLGGWIAYIALEQHGLTNEQRERCTSVIRDFAEGSGPDALAAQWWIEENVTNGRN